MSIHDLLLWGKEHHYPQLVLSEKEVLRHGESAWQKLANGTHDRIEKAFERIQQWNARIAEEAVR